MKKLTLVLALTMAVFGCGKSGDEGGHGSAAAGGEKLKIYRHSMDGSPTNLDPVQSATIYSNHVLINVYHTLYSYKYLSRPYQIKPNLATAMPEVSDDGLTYTIRIEPGVMFIDDEAFPDGKGRELTADDFVYSLKRHFDPKSRSQGAWMWDGFIQGMDEWKAAGADYDTPVSGLRAADKHTISFTLTRPYPQLVHTLAQGFSAIVPREAVEHYGREFSIHPVGTGPFMMKSFDTSRAILVRNPSYHAAPIDIYDEGYDEAIHGQFGVESIHGKTPPLVDRIELSFIKESSARWNSFTKGDEVQFSSIPVEQIPNVTEQLKPDVVLTPEYASRYFVKDQIETGLVMTYLNMRDPEIGYNDDPKRNEMNKVLRCAMRTGFNWAERNKRFYANIGVVYPGVIPPVVPEFDPDVATDSIEYDPERARRLLSEAGWTAENLPELDYGGVASVLQRQFYEQFRGWMVDIGFPPEKVVFNSFATFGDYNKAIKQAKVKVMGMGWGLDYPDAQNTLQLFYGPNGAPGSNNSNYDNPRYDELYRQSSVIGASPERTALYREMNNLVLEDCPVIGALSRTRILLWHKDKVISYPDRQIVGGFHFPYVDVREEAVAP